MISTHLNQQAAGVDLSPRLSEQQVKYVLASKTPAIIKTDAKQAKDRIRDVIRQTFVDFGTVFKGKETQDKIEAIVLQVYEDISEDFKQVTGDDIYLCCRYGVRGKYGEVRWISTAEVYKWIQAYIKNPEREMALKIQRQYDRDKGRPVPPLINTPSQPKIETKHSHEYQYLLTNDALPPMQPTTE